jgi:hypothetical protein
MAQTLLGSEPTKRPSTLLTSGVRDLATDQFEDVLDVPSLAQTGGRPSLVERADRKWNRLPRIMRLQSL